MKYKEYHGFEKGDKVICIEDSKNASRSSSYLILIKKGEVKVIRGVDGEDIWFMDTPQGYGCYPAEDFKKYEPDKIKEEDIEWF